MSRICLRRIRLSRPPQARIGQAARNLHTSTCVQTAAALAPAAVRDLTAFTSKRDPMEMLRWKKLDEFSTSLDLESLGHRRVWSSYVDLLSFLRPDQIPLHLHQKTLRQCTTSIESARYDLVMRMQRKEEIRPGHRHESRFRAIIYNMRQAGYSPGADDYHFILRHFAAVGYHTGSLQVLKEMSHVGLEKTPEAYRFCLQALDRRLTLPCWQENKSEFAEAISKLVSKLLVEMQQNNVEMTSEIVDLCFRILGENLLDGPFEKLMRQAYGIDLNYPDRPPLEYWTTGRTVSAANAPLRASAPYPFTTSALNNTIDFLGRKRRISKLVQAFEVLTTPLPARASTSRDSSYMDDEDEDFGYDRPEVAPYTPPHAQPNTETYTRLIRWISRANNAPLARHYLYQAYQVDLEADRALRTSVSGRKALPHELRIPQCRLTSKMIHYVFGLTNRQKKIPMMRWLLHILRKIKNHRRTGIMFYRNVLERWRPSAGDEERIGPSAPELVETVADEGEIKQKLADLNLQLLVLRREYSRLLLLEEHMIHVMGRQTQRIKERLGRRVWAQKDIYLRTQCARVTVSKEQWRQLVQFRSTRRTVTQNPQDEPALGLPNPHTPIFRVPQLGFFTPSAPYRNIPEISPQQKMGE